MVEHFYYWFLCIYFSFLSHNIMGEMDYILNRSDKLIHSELDIVYSLILDASPNILLVPVLPPTINILPCCWFWIQSTYKNELQCVFLIFQFYGSFNYCKIYILKSTIQNRYGIYIYGVSHVVCLSILNASFNFLSGLVFFIFLKITPYPKILIMINLVWMKLQTCFIGFKTLFKFVVIVFSVILFKYDIYFGKNRVYFWFTVQIPFALFGIWWMPSPLLKRQIVHQGPQ